MIQLSKRLQAVADMVTSGYCLADVGTDHGYIPIYLVQAERVPHAIAMDINRGPLERAREHIRQNGLEERIETRLCDGLAALEEGEVQSVLIAGMGGLLTVHILEEEPGVLDGCRELILQPQSDLRAVRAWLIAHGYEIAEENLVLEEEKFYPMMRAVKRTNKENRRRIADGTYRESANGGPDQCRECANTGTDQYRKCVNTGPGQCRECANTGTDQYGKCVNIGTELAAAEPVPEAELRYGPRLLSDRHPLMRDYLAREEGRKLEVLRSLAGKQTEGAQRRRAEIERDLEILQAAGKYL